MQWQSLRFLKCCLIFFALSLTRKCTSRRFLRCVTTLLRAVLQSAEWPTVIEWTRKHTRLPSFASTPPSRSTGWPLAALPLCEAAQKSTDRKSENKNKWTSIYIHSTWLYILADFYYLNCKILMPYIQEPRILSTNYLSNEVTRVHIYIQQCPNILLRLDSDALASCFSWSMASRLTR